MPARRWIRVRNSARSSPSGRGWRLVGRADTAWCDTADYGPVHHAIAVAGPGEVILIAAGGRMDAAMIGELLSGAARRKGIAGLVVDGPVRDVATERPALLCRLGDAQ